MIFGTLLSVLRFIISAYFRMRDCSLKKQSLRIQAHTLNKCANDRSHEIRRQIVETKADIDGVFGLGSRTGSGSHNAILEQFQKRRIKLVAGFQTLDDPSEKYESLSLRKIQMKISNLQRLDSLMEEFQKYHQSWREHMRDARAII